MPDNEIEKAKEIIAIASEFKQENKEELKMLVSAVDKLESTRKELEDQKKEYRKSIYPNRMKILIACLILSTISFSAKAGCRCVCINGETVQMCDRPTDLPTICTPRICPRW